METRNQGSIDIYWSTPMVGRVRRPTIVLGLARRLPKRPLRDLGRSMGVPMCFMPETN